MTGSNSPPAANAEVNNPIAKVLCFLNHIATAEKVDTPLQKVEPMETIAEAK